MAGFIIFIGGADASLAGLSMERTIERGVYATELIPAPVRWTKSQEGTFADFATMTPGNSVFFFSRRKLYGIGVLTTVGSDCKFANFPGASSPGDVAYEDVRSNMLIDDGPDHLWERWVCTFTPDPYFFTEGIDIDDALSSSPGSFRSLRAMSNVSFARVDDDEEQALKDVILQRNQTALADPHPGTVYAALHQSPHEEIADRLLPAHQLTPAPLLSACANGSAVKHEMALEAGVTAQLAQQDVRTEGVFGKWDYVSHQVLASPFKPLQWADRMDVFGYRYIANHRPTIARYLVIEMKRDDSTIDNVDQAMKYVDWVKDEYAGGDYSLIDAYLLAYRHSDEVRKRVITAGRRVFTLGRRPARLLEWTRLKLVEYRFDASSGLLDFSLVE